MTFSKRSTQRIARSVRRDEQRPTVVSTRPIHRPRWSTGAKLVVIQTSVGPGKSTTGRVYEVTNSDPIAADTTITIAAKSPTEDIVVLNFRPNRLTSGIAYLAHKLGKHWIIENDACFMDFLT